MRQTKLMATTALAAVLAIGALQGTAQAQYREGMLGGPRASDLGNPRYMQPQPMPMPRPPVQPQPMPMPRPSVQPMPTPTPRPSVQPAPVPAPRPSVPPAAAVAPAQPRVMPMQNNPEQPRVGLTDPGPNAGAMVGGQVRVGPNTSVGAGAVVTPSLPPGPIQAPVTGGAVELEHRF